MILLLGVFAIVVNAGLQGAFKAYALWTGAW
jgi:hypothetical protein